MKTRLFLLPFVCSLLLYLSCASTLFAQAFQNLDFEDANLSPIPEGQYGGLVPITNAVPYWTGYFNTKQVSQVLQNNFTLGAPSIDILGPNWGSSSIIQGQYTLVLQSGTDDHPDFTNVLYNAAVGQVGVIPVNSKSILMKVSGANFSVSFAGQVIPVSILGSGPNYTLYGGDVSAFGGQLGELRLSSAFLPGDPYSGGGAIDDISFSTQAIPEPSTLALTVAALTLLFGIGFRRPSYEQR